MLYEVPVQNFIFYEVYFIREKLKNTFYVLRLLMYERSRMYLIKISTKYIYLPMMFVFHQLLSCE